ncbi:CotS family spore coat protein [Clostridium haemolyticum]|uniref:Spore coat protein n=1 Tax=Clostridium haemolyticum NCTC 9693 TaxID=1443114 RepID=A0ABR4TGM6_CLOHA|nr:CotS family spore coat protein [Clostridium haemolyticum]KEI18173.1 spore coat protein [Clostridium haemolyticum NCTC 9693]
MLKILQNVRFKDKKALIQYDLNLKMFEAYDFKVEDIIPVRKVYILVTNKGNKILKKLNYSIDELNFINTGINYIRDNSFNRVFRFEKTKNSEVYNIWNKNIYCIMDLIDGRESEYSNPLDVMVAARGVGQLHKACEGFRYKNKTRYMCGTTIDVFKRKHEELQIFKNVVKLIKSRTEFDEIFLDNVDYYMNEIDRAIDVLEKSNFYKLCSEEDKIILCHHDLAHHNVLIKDDEAYFVDFDYSIIDLKVHDLCNFINKVEKKSAYDFQEFKFILSNYYKYNTLSQTEMEVLYGMMIFPQDFYNISKEYYTRSKEWKYEIFLDKIVKKNGLKYDKREFLEKFRNDLLK